MVKNHNNREKAIWKIPRSPSAGVGSIAALENRFTDEALNTPVFWAGSAICGNFQGSGMATFLALNLDCKGDPTTKTQTPIKHKMAITITRHMFGTPNRDFNEFTTSMMRHYRSMMRLDKGTLQIHYNITINSDKPRT